MIIDVHTHILDTGHWPNEWWDWVAADWVDGLSTKVKGITPSGAGALGNMAFMDAWLA